ncbi:hypothetical protein ACG7TL_008710 [Trametes sanguinea]
MFNKSRAFASTVPGQETKSSPPLRETDAESACAATQPASSPEDAMKQALCSVVQVWLDRLQSMAVVTTFFVSIDSLLFSLTAGTRSADLKAWSMRDQVINASLGGAIIFHAFAAIVAYIGSYVLIRFRLNNAEKVEERTEGQYTTAPARPSAEKRRMKSSHRQSISAASTAAPMSPTDTIRDFPLERKTDPEASVKDAAIAGLENIVGVLSRAHNVSAAMASLGFILALLGILTYSWTAVPTSLGIFASVCMGVCFLAALVAFR